MILLVPLTKGRPVCDLNPIPDLRESRVLELKKAQAFRKQAVGVLRSKERVSKPPKTCLSISLLGDQPMSSLHQPPPLCHLAAVTCPPMSLWMLWRACVAETGNHPVCPKHGWSKGLELLGRGMNLSAADSQIWASVVAVR